MPTKPNVPQLVKLRYIGTNGDFLPGVPAADVEVASDQVDELVKSGLFKRDNTKTAEEGS